MFALSAMIAIVVHEVAHGFIALKNGDNTAKCAGRLTLDPTKHFDVTGVLLFALVGIGWAKPVPINPNNFKKPRLGMFTVAIAGVVANFILAAISFVLFCLLANVVENEIINMIITYFLLFMVLINTCLIAFNILPIFPLDGFRVFEAFSKPENKYRLFMYKYGAWILLGLFVADVFLSQFGYGPLTLYIEFVQNGIINLFEWVRGWFV